MSLDAAKNFAKVQVSTGYDADDTSIVLASGHGAKLPTAPFNVVWWNATDYPDPADDPNVEIVRVTAITDDTLTVTRAQESTEASTKNEAGKTYLMIAGPTAKLVADVANVDNHTDGTTNKVFTATEKTKLSGIEASADVTDAGNVGAAIHGASAKTTPVDDDTVSLIDSAASNVLKKLSWANIKATLKTYFDTLYQPVGGGAPTGETFIPLPPLAVDDIATSIPQDDTTTTAWASLFNLPHAITVTSISLACLYNSQDTTFQVAIYSEDGQTKHIDVTTSAITSGGNHVTASVSSVTLDPGNYYIVVVRKTGNSGFYTQQFISTTWNALNGYDLTSKRKIAGTMTVSSGALPSTFDPVTDLTEYTSSPIGWIIFRLDS